MNKLLLAFAALLMTFGFSIEGKAQRNHRKHFYKRRSRMMSGHTQRSKFDKKHQKYAIGFAFGPANYFGDLAPKPTRTSFDASLTHLNMRLSLQRRVHYNVSWRVSAGWVHLRGNDYISADPTDQEYVWRYLRNQHFRNNMFEVSATGLFDIFSHHGNSYTRHPVAPYAVLGISFLLHNPQARAPLAEDAEAFNADWDGEWQDLSDLGTAGEEYSNFQVAIPAGLGVHYRASNKIDIGLEIAYRFTFTDYLDDVGAEFVSDEELAQMTPLQRAMHNRTGQQFDAKTEENRNLNEVFGDIARTRTGQAGGAGRPTFEAMPVADEDGNLIPDPEGAGRRIDGFERGGHPRGNDANDIYVLTQIQIKYILGAAQNRKPKFR